jgi:hypothetical protein
MTEPIEDPYVVLGVARDATDAEIRRTYETRLNAAAAAGALRVAQRLDAAYSILSDPHRREIYDREGRVVDLPRLAPEPHWTPAPPAAQQGARAWSNQQPRPRRGRKLLGRSARASLVAVIVLAVAAAGVKLGLLHNATGQQLLAANDVWPAPSTTTTTGFPLHHSSHRTRLLPPVTPPAAKGPYAFRSPGGVADDPVRWDPCAPIRYVISGNEPYPGAADALTSAINEISADTGLEFVYAGTTTEIPTEQRSPYQPSRYGEKWAPVLVAWTDPSVVPGLAGRIVGLGGGPTATFGAQTRLVSGVVVLDGPDLARMAQRPNGTVEARAVMLHELGHLIGLAHVKDRSQVMNPTASPLAHYGAGDRRGLAILGAGPCPTDY